MIPILIDEFLYEMVAIDKKVCRFTDTICYDCKIKNRLPEWHGSTQMRRNEWCNWYLNKLGKYDTNTDA